MHIPLSFLHRCAATFSPVFAGFALAALLLAGGPSRALAVQIDVSLNLFYQTPSNPNSGGTWTLSAKTDESGLAALNVFLQGVQAGPGQITLVAPTGAVNGFEPAGFFLAQAPNPSYVDLGIFQAPNGDAVGDQTVFYGVGSIDNAPQGAAPNYPGQPVGTLSIGPAYTSLSNVQNGVWGTGDLLGDADWDRAAVLLSGTFAPGSTPSFYQSGAVVPTGRVFLDTGTANTAGTTSAFDETIVTTLIRSNLLTDVGGDYNGDGVIDAADYTVWRNSLGAIVTPFSGADGSGNGVIDGEDYTIWKNNFGALLPGAGSLGLAATSVPEPKALVLATFSLVMASWASGRRIAVYRSKSATLAGIFENFLNTRETA